MLCLSRRAKESVIIDGNIEVKINEILPRHVRMCFDAPREIQIFRKEIPCMKLCSRDKLKELLSKCYTYVPIELRVQISSNLQ